MASTVAAIVSAYNAQQFIRGRIDDLMRQTLYAQGRLEIVVVNSGSTDQTGRILQDEYLTNIRLITSLREPMYTAWNRAIAFTQADYIVPANCDDRLAPDALEIMAAALDSYADVGLVCGDSYVTTTANATWDSAYELSHEPPYIEGRLNYPPPEPLTLARHCVVGNTPMWRRSLHAEHGMFDESYLVAGDYEWALRLAANGVKMLRLDAMVGLFYWHPSQLGRAQADQSAYESTRAVYKWADVIERNDAIIQSSERAVHPS